MNDYIELTDHHPVDLAKLPTKIKPCYNSAKKYSILLQKNREALQEYQVLLYAGHTQSMLIVFQGMDTAGKDGAIKHVMSGVNPQGCRVVSFKSPTPAELDHDYLWRVDRAMPARGQIGIFNRSYYEEALVTRVHPKLLIAEKLPKRKKPDNLFWLSRYQDIMNHEDFLRRQGYEIVKIFIHISKAEQKRRLMSRFQDPKKFWKISEGDVHERSFWKKYQKAYEDCLRNTASKGNPWYVVPGDDKENARLMISKILVSRFKRMRLKYPELTHTERRELKKLKTELKRD